MYVMKLKDAVTDTTIPVLRKDQLLADANDGVRFLFDLAFPGSYSGGAPTTGAAVSDIGAISANGALTIHSGELLSFAGGGIDFSSISKVGSYLSLPASVAADVAANVNDYYLACLYLRLPTLANWNSNSSIAPFMQFAATGYTSGPELVTFCFKSGGILSARRQYAAATVTNIEIAPKSADYGSIAQLAFWRNADGQGFRLKSANGEVSGGAAVGTNNTQDFSALSCKIGCVPGVFAGNAGSALLTGMTNAWDMRLYRGFLENLERSGRTPTTVLDDDWVRTVARSAFS